MAKVKVNYRPSAKEGRAGTVCYQVTHAGKTRRISTGYMIFPTEWDARKSTVKCIAESVRRSFVLTVRAQIKADLERLGRVIRQLENTMPHYAADDIVEEYTRILGSNLLFGYMDGIIVKLKGNGQVRTAETYRATLNSFRKFRNDEDLLIEGLSRDVMQSYERWLKQRGLSPNTISFYIRIIRAVYNRAVEDGLTDDRTPFKRVYTGVEKTMKRALPLSVIKQIRVFDLSQDPKLEYARDMFILSFMLRGMSFIDMAFLKKSDLRDGYITYRRRKTGQLLIIEWTKEMQEVVDRHPSGATDYLLPIIRNKDSLSVYAYRHAGSMINRRLKMIADRMQLDRPLTMYVARHSWASAAKAKGIPISVISEGMGHDSEQTTQIYLASLERTVVDNANSVLLDALSDSL